MIVDHRSPLAGKEFNLRYLKTVQVALEKYFMCAGCNSFRGINVSMFQNINSYDILLFFEYKYLDMHISNHYSPLMW